MGGVVSVAVQSKGKHDDTDGYIATLPLLEGSYYGFMWEEGTYCAALIEGTHACIDSSRCVQGNHSHSFILAVVVYDRSTGIGPTANKMNAGADSCACFHPRASY